MLSPGELVGLVSLAEAGEGLLKSFGSSLSGIEIMNPERLRKSREQEQGSATQHEVSIMTCSMKLFFSPKLLMGFSASQYDSYL